MSACKHGLDGAYTVCPLCPQPTTIRLTPESVEENTATALRALASELDTLAARHILPDTAEDAALLRFAADRLEKLEAENATMRATIRDEHARRVKRSGALMCVCEVCIPGAARASLPTQDQTK